MRRDHQCGFFHPAESPDEATAADQESEDDLSASRTSLERQAPHRGNTMVHVCWHRNTSVSMVDFSVAVEVPVERGSGGWALSSPPLYLSRQSPHTASGPGPAASLAPVPGHCQPSRGGRSLGLEPTVVTPTGAVEWTLPLQLQLLLSISLHCHLQEPWFSLVSSFLCSRGAGHRAESVRVCGSVFMALSWSCHLGVRCMRRL